MVDQVTSGGARRRLLRNVIRCRQCGDVIESRSVHDYVRCRCGQAAVDGGLMYPRRVCGEAGFEELAEYEGEPGP